MGKGSTRRQPQIDDQTLKSNWDAIFGKKEKKHDGQREQPRSTTTATRQGFRR